MRMFDRKTTRFHKSFTRISTLHWDLAKDHLDGLHVKMVGIQLGFPEIVRGSRRQWWWFEEGGEDCRSLQLRDVSLVLPSELRTSDWS